MSKFSIDDHNFMSRAIRLAEKGRYTTDPNPRVGCVIVKNQEVVGEGFHQRAGEPHAEIHALNHAKKKAQGATAYVTLEPCSHTGKTPPCSSALIKAGVDRVVAAMQDPNPQVAGSGLQQLSAAGIKVETGLLEPKAIALNRGFVKRMLEGLPWVRVKLAMSLDGRTAMQSGESKWISSPESRRDVQLLRAASSAVLTGIGTVLHDDPSLNVRLSSKELGISGSVRQPVRVIMDSHLQTPPNARLFQLEGESWIFTSGDKNAHFRRLEKSGAILFHQSTKPKWSIEDTLRQLAEKQINEVHVEAGATLCGSLLEQQLVDEIVLYMAPHIMGSNTRGLFHLPQLGQMSDRIKMKIKDVRSIGDDLRITLIPSY